MNLRDYSLIEWVDGANRVLFQQTEAGEVRISGQLEHEDFGQYPLTFHGTWPEDYDLKGASPWLTLPSGGRSDWRIDKIRPCADSTLYLKAVNDLTSAHQYVSFFAPDRAVLRRELVDQCDDAPDMAGAWGLLGALDRTILDLAATVSGVSRERVIAGALARAAEEMRQSFTMAVDAYAPPVVF